MVERTLGAAKNQEGELGLRSWRGRKREGAEWKSTGP